MNRKTLSKCMAILFAFALVFPIVVNPQETAAETPEFFEDFNGSALDTSKWLVAKRQWGGINANGGVVPENVKVANGKLILEAHGDLYTGPVKGINKDGTLRADGKRVGAAVATKDYYGSGSYEFSMKVAPKFGVCSAVWTFHYQEVEPGDPQYQGSGDYYVVNHEIDIEIPGRTGPEHTNIDFNKALLNTWQGENEGEYTTGYTNLGKYVNDGQFHTYRFDWHTGGNGETKRVDFYLDGVFLRSITTHIPDIAGRLWLGAWFPNGWTGTPNFDTETFEIDWVRITPFDEPGDRFIPETYPNDGWADPVTDTEAPSIPTNLNSPTKTSTSVDLSWTASTDNVG
ncbi:MAG: glycoside hydrolase family 16 protein, partial [Paenibacillaceae bacterium]